MPAVENSEVDLADKSYQEAKEVWEKLDKLVIKKWKYYCKKVDSKSDSDIDDIVPAYKSWIKAIAVASEACEILIAKEKALRALLDEPAKKSIEDTQNEQS